MILIKYWYGIWTISRYVLSFFFSFLFFFVFSEAIIECEDYHPRNRASGGRSRTFRCFLVLKMILRSIYVIPLTYFIVIFLLLTVKSRYFLLFSAFFYSMFFNGFPHIYIFIYRQYIYIYKHVYLYNFFFFLRWDLYFW